MSPLPMVAVNPVTCMAHECSSAVPGRFGQARRRRQLGCSRDRRFLDPSGERPALSRKVAGAKAHFFPTRGDPAKWEVKATETIRPNPWKRRKNRDLVDETLRILRLLNCTKTTTHSGRRYTNEILLF